MIDDERFITSNMVIGAAVGVIMGFVFVCIVAILLWAATVVT